MLPQHKQTASFELNGTRYLTDLSTLETLRSIVPGAKHTGDTSALQAVLHLGIKVGRIRPALN